jgi:hypothetical protein
MNVVPDETESHSHNPCASITPSLMLLIQIPNKAHPTHPLLASLRTITLTTECVSSLPTVSKFIFAILFHIPPILLCIAECGTIPTVTGLPMPLWANLRRLTKLHLRNGSSIQYLRECTCSSTNPEKSEVGLWLCLIVVGKEEEGTAQK